MIKSFENFVNESKSINEKITWDVNSVELLDTKREKAVASKYKLTLPPITVKDVYAKKAKSNIGFPYPEITIVLSNGHKIELRSPNTVSIKIIYSESGRNYDINYGDLLHDWASTDTKSIIGNMLKDYSEWYKEEYLK